MKAVIQNDLSLPKFVIFGFSEVKWFNCGSNGDCIRLTTGF